MMVLEDVKNISERKIRFEISEVIKYKEGVMVIGRCKNSPIKVNDIFSYMSNPVYEKLDGFVDFCRYDECHEVILSVKEIHCFHRLVVELPIQYTGGLYIVGNEVGIVKLGWELTNIL